MIRKIMFGFALAAGAGLVVGCDSGTKETKGPGKTEAMMKDQHEKMAKERNPVTEATKAVADKGKEMADAAKAAMDKAKGDFLKPMEDMYPKIEEKIKGLTGDAGTKAKTAFDAVKKSIEEFKASPAEKYKDLMGGITAKFDELKKMLKL